MKDNTSRAEICKIVRFVIFQKSIHALEKQKLRYKK